MLRSVALMLLSALLAFLVLGVDGRDTTAVGDPGAWVALREVTDGAPAPGDPAAAFPADWVTVMGYLPEVVSGPNGSMLIKPSGDCSSASGQTEFRFGAVCAQHDLAYDVLRYSERVGDPLPATARQAADAMFSRQLHSQCALTSTSRVHSLWCQAWATGFAVTVEFNSWRQGYRPPRVGELQSRWDAVALLFVLIVLGRARLDRLDRSLTRITVGRRFDRHVLLLSEPLSAWHVRGSSTRSPSPGPGWKSGPCTSTSPASLTSVS